MITLRKMAYQAITDLSGGKISKDSPYKEEYAILAIRQTMNEVFLIKLIERRSGGTEDDRNAPSEAIATYKGIDVLHEDDTDRDYVNIPDFYFSMKYNRGIHAVADMKKPLKNFIPFHNPSVVSRLPAAGLEGDNVGYYVEDNKIYFMKKISSKVPKILMKLLVLAPDKYGPNDVLPIPADMAAVVLDRVKERLRANFIQDKINDNNKDIGVNVAN